MKEQKSFGEGLGISGFTVAVLGIVFAGYVGIIMSIIGIIFCYVQQRRNPNKLAKAGIIIGIIGIVLSIAYVIVFIRYLAPIVNSQGLQY